MTYDTLAAVDLGSNSFRLQVGRVVGDQIYPLDSLKEPVRLASGLDAEKRLDGASQARALDCLLYFGERLRGLEKGAVRAVATNTLRVAKNAMQFLPQAEAALGFPIEVIAGREEARLIYIGASHSLPTAAHKRLVIDIGGGSTEFIIGKRHDPQLMESLYIGCVSYTLRYFPDRRIDRRRMREAQVAAAKEVELIAHDFQRMGWIEAIGSSGSARSIADILEMNHLNPNDESGITRVGLDRLCDLLIKAGSAEALDLPGVKGDRLPVLPGGIAIMSAIFEELGIERMTYADGALRLGVLYDLLGRFHHHDMRDVTVAQFMQRYHVDAQQARRVGAYAAALHEKLAGNAIDENASQLLGWAAKLHEIGIPVAYSGYHRHSAYIISNADMPGFSREEQEHLAALVLSHRRSLKKSWEAFPEADDRAIVLAFRLAVLLCRGRRDARFPPLDIKLQGDRVRLAFDAVWLEANPLTATALREEVAEWARIGHELKIPGLDDIVLAQESALAE